MFRKLLKNYQLGFLGAILGIIVLFLISSYPGTPHFFTYAVIFCSWLTLLLFGLKSLRKKRLGTEVFLLCATVFAVIGKQEHAIIIVLIIMLIARYIETLVEYRAKNSLEKLVRLIPAQVTTIVDGQERMVPLHDVAPGMLIVVKTGGRIPVDGVIAEGTALVNESSLTGESMPRTKENGNAVFASTFLEEGSLIIKVEKVKEETFFGKITLLLLEAEHKKTKLSLFTDTLAIFFVPVVFGCIMVVWLITRDFELAVTLLVFGSPLELVLVTPLTMLAGTLAAFRHGILVKGGFALERLARVDTMMFDKTGTLTLGEPLLVNVESYVSDMSPDKILQLAAIAEKRAGHVVARAILAGARDKKLHVDDPDSYRSLVGHGVEITYHGKKYMLGNLHFIEAHEHGNVHVGRHKSVCKDEGSHSSFYLASEKRVLGKVCVTDSLRPEAYAALGMLKKRGITYLVLLSGDRQEVAVNIASRLGVPIAYGDMFPQQKTALLQSWEKKGHAVAMVGDGINDAPALKAASVGVAMGGMGMEPAIDAADIVLMTNDLRKLCFVVDLAKQAIRTIKQNLFFGFACTHLLGMGLAFAHMINPIQASLLHAITDILILLNSVRMAHFGSRKKR